MSRRNEVANFSVQQTSHAGLWLDKFIWGFERAPNATETPQSILVSEVAKKITQPEAYKFFFERWKKSLQDAGVAKKNMREAKVQGRLAVGLGGASVLETAITLHHTYGVPFIPGSALKGLAASYARNRLDDDAWNKGEEAYTVMFGDTNSAGYVTFFDALYVPGSGHNRQVLWPDVITVHHKDYYGGKDSAPADWDSPTPVPFLSATGKYLIALQGDDAWVALAFDILNAALQEEGVGAKTSSGYGRMRIVGMPVVSASPAPQSQAPPDEPPEAELETVMRRGKVTRLFSSRRGGVTGGNVRDTASGQEFHFSIKVVVGNHPGKKSSVVFKTQGNNVIYLKRA